METTGRGTLLLGVGAQKAGTTWLYRQLSRSEAFAQPFRKELHVLDVASLPSHGWMRRKIEAEAQTTSEDGVGSPTHRLRLADDLDAYADYLAGLLDAPGVLATADITPSYALLRAETVVAVREAMAARGVRTVAVFLMRDPVERLWSQVRMRHDRPRAGETGARDAVADFREALRRPGFRARSGYLQTLDMLAEALPSSAVHLGLYEDLVADPATWHAIRELVGLPHLEPELEQRANVSSTRADLPEALAQRAATRFADVYREVARRHPEFDVARRWRHASHVL